MRCVMVYLSWCTASVGAATSTLSVAHPQLPYGLDACAAQLMFMFGSSPFLHDPDPHEAGLPPRNSDRSRGDSAGQCHQQH